MYKVKDVETGKELVLKDVWIDDTRKLEHDIVAELLKDVEATSGTEAMNVVKKHILTIKRHALVRVNVEEDHTINMIMRGKVPNTEKQVELIDPIVKDIKRMRSSGFVSCMDQTTIKTKQFQCIT